MAEITAKSSPEISPTKLPTIDLNIIVEEQEEDEEEATETFTLTSLKETESGCLITNSHQEVVQQATDDEQSDAELSDSAWDTDLETEEKIDRYDSTGRTSYLQTCYSMGLTPVSYFLRCIVTSKIDLKHHGLGHKGTRAMAIALVSNTTVLELNLSDNYIEAEGAYAVAEMLKENCYITSLDVSRNKIGSSGCACICDMLQNNSSLLHLSMASNDLSDKDGDALAEAFRGNFKLTYLNLSDNKLGENAGDKLGPGITANDAIEHLDLSWNTIRKKGAVSIGLGLKANCTLKTLNLSWNGFANDGAVALAEALNANNTLTELDASNNRITTDGALCMAKGLEGNNTLEVLKIGNNPIDNCGACAILKAIKNYVDNALVELHIRGIYLNEEFDQLFKEVNEIRPIKLYAMVRPKEKHVLKLLKEYIASDQDRWLGFFTKYDPDQTRRVTRRTFAEILKNANITMGPEEMVRILNKLDTHGDGFLHYTVEEINDAEEWEGKSYLNIIKIFQPEEIKSGKDKKKKKKKR